MFPCRDDTGYSGGEYVCRVVLVGAGSFGLFDRRPVVCGHCRKPAGHFRSLPFHAVAYLPRYAIHEGDAAAGLQNPYQPYGNFLLVAAGNGYEMTTGMLSDVNVKIGDTVTAGQLLGTVAEPTAYYKEEGPGIYFAMTKDGIPVNPMDYLGE